MALVRTPAWVVLATVAWGLFPAAAHAQTREADAERLFREGQKLMEERRYGEACPKFDAAYKKDGALGTLLNLAFCHKEQGAIWYAWLEFREAEVKAAALGRADRRDFARARIVQLQKNLPRVVIDNPRKVPLSDVFVEDRKVWQAESGEAFAVEAGPRKFTFRAKGKKPATVLVDVVRHARAQRVVVPDLEDVTADDLPPAPPAPVPKADVVTPPPPVAARPSAHSSAQRTAGWLAIGVGGGAAGLGLVTGALSFFGPCGGKSCPPERRDAASTTAAVSTLSFVVAGAALAGGVVLLATAPSRVETASRNAPRGRAHRVHAEAVVGPTWAGVSGTF